MSAARTRLSAAAVASTLALTVAACSATPPDAAPAGESATATPAASTPANPPRQAPPMSDPLPATPMTCNAENAKAESIGHAATEATIERARIAAGAESVRVIKPGMMVTMDFVESRLNVDVDEAGVIVNLRCG